MRRSTPTVSLLFALAGSFSLNACGDAAPRSAERFCGELTAHAAAINTPPLTVEATTELITLLSRMGEVAPKEIQGDWDELYGTLKTASTVDVEDPASLQVVTDAAYASVRPASKVVAWASTNCNLDLGPVAIVPGGADVAPSTTTTVDAD